MPWSDEQLIDGLRKRDPEALTELMARFQHQLYSAALNITRSAEDAEEILQDVFLTVYNKIDTFKGESAFGSWVHRIGLNCAYMKIRGERRKRELALEDVEPNFLADGHLAPTSDWAESAESLLIDHEFRAAIDAAVAALPEEYRTVFVLRDVNDLSNEEVAETLGLSVAAVKSRLHRARLFVRKKLTHARRYTQ